LIDFIPEVRTYIGFFECNLNTVLALSIWIELKEAFLSVPIGPATYFRAEWNSSSWRCWWGWCVESKAPTSISRPFRFPAFWYSEPAIVGARPPWQCSGLYYIQIAFYSPSSSKAFLSRM
jgi:hypothetical protein